MLEIYLIRHGETDWNVERRLQGIEDIPMNGTGIRQAESLADSIRKINADAILSSPLKRALFTAEILNKKLQLNPIYLREDLKERNYGKASGLTPDEKHARFPDGDIPDLEPITSVRARMSKFLDDMVQEFSGKKILVVSHGGVINCILSILSSGVVGTGKTAVSNCSVSKVVYDGNWKVEYFDQDITSVLPGL